MASRTKSKLPPFAAALRDLLDAQGISISELASRTGINRVSLSRIVSGKQAPTWATVEAIAMALRVSTETFRRNPV